MKWFKFELVNVFAAVMFILAGAGGLVALWVALAFAPAALPTITPQDAAHLFAVSCFIIALSVALAVAARAMVVKAWMSIAKGQSFPDAVRVFHAFITGHGIVLAWAGVLAIIYIPALLFISPFMSLLVAGMVYGSFRAYVATSAALASYDEVKASGSGAAGSWPVGLMFVALVLLVLGAASVHQLATSVQRARASLIAPAKAELSIIDGQLHGKASDLPTVEQVHSERIEAESAVTRAETISYGKGYASEAELMTSRSRLLQAQADALRVVGEARDAIARLSRDKIEAQRKLDAVSSAAPALHH